MLYFFLQQKQYLACANVCISKGKFIKQFEEQRVSFYFIFVTEIQFIYLLSAS